MIISSFLTAAGCCPHGSGELFCRSFASSACERLWSGDQHAQSRTWFSLSFSDLTSECFSLGSLEQRWHPRHWGRVRGLFCSPSDKSDSEFLLDSQ